jgi:hypothetical protein
VAIVYWVADRWRQSFARFHLRRKRDAEFAQSPVIGRRRVVASFDKLRRTVVCGI